MIWFALLCLTVGWEYTMGVFIPARLDIAAIFFTSGSLGLFFGLWRATPVNTEKKRLTFTFFNSLIILFSVVVFQFLFVLLYFWMAPHFHAVPLLSKPLDVLLSIIGNETAQHSEFIYVFGSKTQCFSFGIQNRPIELDHGAIVKKRVDISSKM